MKESIEWECQDMHKNTLITDSYTVSISRQPGRLSAFCAAALICAAATAMTMVSTERAFAKGLNDLAEDAPEAKPEDAAKTDAGGEKTDANADAPAEPKVDPSAEPSAEPKKEPEGEAAATTPAVEPVVQSEFSKSIANKISLETSFGWASARRSEGTWRGGGVSDLSLGYKLPVEIMPNLALWGTFRFAPIAISGELEGNGYRGVWEAYNFGALARYAINATLDVLGTFELGYVLVHLNSLDYLEKKKDGNTNGILVSVGGGADWEALPKFAIGPRVHLGFGGFTVMQGAVAATFKF